jgi:hypothetical protein
MEKNSLKLNNLKDLLKNNFKIFKTLFLNLNSTNAKRGAIIIFTILILVPILFATLSLAKIFIPRIRAVTEASNSVVAFYAADSAIEWCLYNNRGKIPTLSQPVMGNGATYQIFRGNALTTCPSTDPNLNYRATGTFRGVSRSLEISE